MDTEGKKGPNKINVSSSSLVALKAELLSKQAQVQQAKAEGSGIIRSRPAKEKKSKPKSNTGVQERALRDEAQNITEMPTLEKSRLMLEEKAKLYETLSKDKSLLGEDTISEEQSFFLVNFQQKVVDDVIKKRREEQQSKSKKPAKKYESSSSSDEAVGEEADYPASNPDEEWVDYVDSFGRTRRCLRKDLPTFQRQDADLKKDENKASSAPSYTNFVKSSEPSNFPEGPADEAEEARRARRLKWEEEEAENARKSKLHYQDILYQEARQHGVGFYSFSKDESERAKQMEELDNLRRQTETGRAAAVSAASTKRAALDARLKKVRECKRQKLGLPPLKEKPAPVPQEEPLPVPTPPELASEEDQKKLTLTRGIPKTVKIRPWDIGKEGVPTIKRPAVVIPNAWVDKKREERPKEFAPPSAYDSNRPKKPENRKQQRESAPLPQTPVLTEESITAGLAFFKQMNSGQPARAPDPPEEEDDDDLYPPGMEDTRPPHRSGAAIPPPSSMEYYNSGGIGNRRGTAPPRADLAESFRQGLQNRRT